jgi:hypothetical protein
MHTRSLKVAVQGLDFMAHSLHIQTYIHTSLFILNVIRNIQIHSVGKVQGILMLKQMLHKVITTLQGVNAAVAM